MLIRVGFFEKNESKQGIEGDEKVAMQIFGQKHSRQRVKPV